MITIDQLAPGQVSIVQGMMKDYLAWVFTLQDASQDAPTFKGVDEEIADLPGIFAPPKGRFLVAELDCQVVGCVALKPIDENTCELKRLYVKQQARRHGVGQALVEKIVWEARQIGYKKMVLDSHKKMAGAHLLYRMAGFKDAAAPPDFPESLKDHVVFMERSLVPYGAPAG
jgi:putative acetyltransferase